MERKPQVHLLANKKSGHGRGAGLVTKAQKLCDELGLELIDYDLQSPSDLEKQSQLAIGKASAHQDLVIAAGGDGTIRSVAQAAHGKNLRFAVVPCGTFNFFARTHRIPEDIDEALLLALTGTTRPVRLGEVNGHIFLINASLGLYAKAIREREQRTRRFGRNRLVVIFSTIISLLSEHTLLKIELMVNDKLVSLRTPMIFIGNNALQLRGLAMDVAACMKQNKLAVVLLKPVTKKEALRIVGRGLIKTLDNEENLASFCVDEMTIFTNKPQHMMALDGEIFRFSSPLKVKALPGVLPLVCPPPETPA